MAQHGKNADEIVSYIEQIKPKVRASFVVDTLVYLYRGGRCSGLAAMAGGVLKLHPRIGVAQGKMSPGKKYRGKISKVVMDYVKEYGGRFNGSQKDRVFITHSGCDKEKSLTM
ncbi:MAG: DegV family protein [Coprococcus phoceensis]